MPGPLKPSYALLMPGLLRLSCALLIPGPLRLGYTLLILGPLELSCTPLLMLNSAYLALGIHPLLIPSLLDSTCLALGIYLLNLGYTSFPDLLDLPPLLAPILPELLGIVSLVVQSALLDLLENIIPISTSICSKYLVIS